MKKLMFAVAAVAAGAAFADEAIVSANVVGYQQFATKDTLESGSPDSWTSVGLPFGQVGTMGGVVIDTNIFDRVAVVNDQVIIYNPEASDYDIYAFQGFDGETCLGWNFTHYNDEWQLVTDSGIQSFTVNYGEGIEMQPWDYSEVTMTTSGQVADLAKPQKWEMPVGVWAQAIMNPYPVDTTFADIETFAKVNDVIYIVNPAAMDCDIYAYQGTGNGWVTQTWGSDWQLHDGTVPAGSTDVILPAGAVGYYINYEADGREWTVNLNK